MRICSIDGCETIHEAKGFCNKHYVRFLKHGDPLKIGSQKPKLIIKCSMEDCNYNQDAKGLCKNHYAKHYRLNRKSALPICSLENCNRVAKGLRLCNRHYLRFKKNKLINKKSCYELTLKERLMQFCVIDNDSGCWNWISAKNKKGYGCLSLDSKTAIAHRESYKEFIGEIPKGLLVCHKCDRPSCINPEHLFLGTDKDNAEDKINKGRHVACSGEDNGHSKLSTKNVIEIKKMLKGNLTLVKISKQFNVTPETIGYIKRNETWRHINV